jgi:hypothetical protein
MATHGDYASVCRLDTASLRRLLEGGDAPERLWAAWALALRRRWTEEDPARMNDEPSAGVRAGLCTLLAAHKDVQVLARLAAEDHAALVRAQATRLLARLLGPSDVELHRRLAEIAASDPVAEVRGIVFEELRLDVPDFVDDVAVRALTDRDPTVRLAAFDFVAKRTHAGRPLMSVLRERAQLEIDVDARRHFVRALLASDGARFLSVVASWEPARVAEVLEALRETSASLPRDVTTLLRARREAEIDAELWLLHRRGQAELRLASSLAIATDSATTWPWELRKKVMAAVEGEEQGPIAEVLARVHARDEVDSEEIAALRRLVEDLERDRSERLKWFLEYDPDVDESFVAEPGVFDPVVAARTELERLAR